MPKISKVRSLSAKGSKRSKPAEAKPKDELTDVRCCRCGKIYKKQKANFPVSQSTLFTGNNRYVPVCYNCMEELYTHYKTILGREEFAMKRLCLKFDFYWSKDLWISLEKRNTTNSRIKEYLSRLGLYKYNSKTYDDTLDELAFVNGDTVDMPALDKPIYSLDTIEDEDIDAEVAALKAEQQPTVTQEMINYWGAGFTPFLYIELENRRKYWMSQYPPGTELTLGEEAILRQICKLEMTINQDLASGKSIERSVNALNNLLGSMNIKPSQQAKDSEDSYVPFGVEIARWEDERPILEPDDEFKDVDKIHKNVIAWFLGSLCKTAGIKNEYSEEFEKEMAKYTVERPKFDDEEYDDVDDTDDDLDDEPDLAADYGDEDEDV